MRFYIFCVALIMLQGCALGNITAVHKASAITPDNQAGGPYGVFIDAKQRAIISNVVGGETKYDYAPDGKYLGSTKTEGQRIVCAEPSPDALSAIAAQAGISASALSKAFQASGGVSESAGNIGLRTQTIQTLRDGFYRVCEAQMNGLPPEQYAIMLRRFQTNMIALLAIEQLTSTVTGPDTALSSVAGDPLSQKAIYAQRAAVASTVKTAREEELNAVNKTLTPLETAKATCAALPADQDPKPDECSDTKVAERNTNITKLTDQKTALTKQVSEAEAERARQQELASNASDGEKPQAYAASGSVRFASTPTSDVAKAVETIALEVLRQDYGVTMCVEYLRNGTAGDAKNNCDLILNAYAAQLQSRAKATTIDFEKQKFLLELERQKVLSATTFTKFQLESLKEVRIAILEDRKIEASEEAILRDILGISEVSIDALDGGDGKEENRPTSRIIIKKTPADNIQQVFRGITGEPNDTNSGPPVPVDNFDAMVSFRDDRSSSWESLMALGGGDDLDVDTSPEG